MYTREEHASRQGQQYSNQLKLIEISLDVDH